MVFEKLILKPADVGKKHLNHRQAVETRGQPLIFHYSSAPPAISRERSLITETDRGFGRGFCPAQPCLEMLHIQVEHRCDVQREKLGHDKTTNNR